MSSSYASQGDIPIPLICLPKTLKHKISILDVLNYPADDYLIVGFEIFFMGVVGRRSNFGHQPSINQRY